MKYFFTFLLPVIVILEAPAQNVTVEGWVKTGREPVPFASVYSQKQGTGTSTNDQGYFILKDLQPGKQTIIARAIGYVTVEKTMILSEGEVREAVFDLKEDVMGLEEIVISGARTEKRRIESVVAVNVLDQEVFGLTQSSALLEGLNFQPGIRTEVDCQTCNYSQVRMNGLGGSYSQILINSRPVFSSLQGLYGLEQIPSSMVERVEIIRGGGSALYGSGAIAGVINIITKVPNRPAYEITMDHSIIDGESADNILNAAASGVNEAEDAGISVFTSRRRRQAYDANGDGYTEMPRIENNSFGVNSFYAFNEKSRIDLNVFAVNENRRGGNKLDEAAHIADQSEDRIQDALTGGLSYSYAWGEGKDKFSIYTAGQRTGRKHYTGIIPDILGNSETGATDSTAYLAHFLNPPYGTTISKTFQAGIQMDHHIKRFMGGSNIVTYGAEYYYDYVDDEIEAYRYRINQANRSVGLFLQSEWQVSKATLLAGARLTRHSGVNHLIASPRAAFLFKFNSELQFRASYAGGFRAPQAFDADLHIAFAGGGISLINLSPDLHEETSHSLSASVDFNHSTMNYIYGFTIEGFTTRLIDSFVLEEAGEDGNGNRILEKRNGGGSTVSGMTFEARANYNGLFQLQAGLSLQKSLYDRPVAWSDEAPAERNYLRTPETYGFYTLSYLPPKGLTIAWSGVLTGRMLTPHFGGAPGVDGDRTVYLPTFWTSNIKAEYQFSLKKPEQDIRVFAGVRNLFNQYQDDFDIGKNRDSNYIYGPAAPRTVFFGIAIGIL